MVDKCSQQLQQQRLKLHQQLLPARASLTKLLQFLSPGMEIYKGLQIIEQQFSIFARNCQGRELFESWSGSWEGAAAIAAAAAAANLNWFYTACPQDTQVHKCWENFSSRSRRRLALRNTCCCCCCRCCSCCCCSSATRHASCSYKLYMASGLSSQCCLQDFWR